METRRCNTHGRGLVGGGHGGMCEGGRSEDFGLPFASSFAQWPNNMMIDLLKKYEELYMADGVSQTLYLECRKI